MERYQNFARSVLAPGVAIAAPTIAVYEVGTATFATIYSDDLATPTPKSNPFLGDANGYYYFYASAGRYDVRVSGGTPAISTYTLGDVQVGPGLPAAFSDTRSGLPWTPVRQLWVPTDSPKQLRTLYIDGNSGNEMGSSAALNTPQQVMLKDTWHTIDIADLGLPDNAVAVLLLAQFVSSGYANLPPVSLTLSARTPGSALSDGDYFAAVTAGPGGGFRSEGTGVVPLVNHQFEIYFQQPISSTAAAIAGGTGAPQIINCSIQAIYGGDPS